MQDLKNAQFKRDNVLLWLSLSKIQSESESHYFVTMSGDDRDWVNPLIF